MPFLDNQGSLQEPVRASVVAEGAASAERERKRSLVEGEILVRDAFDGAVERHIEVGDGLQMMVISRMGWKQGSINLSRGLDTEARRMLAVGKR